MIIKNNGYVGIGTQNPPNNLSVVGNADFSGSLGIGTTAINASAKLEISSGSQGFLPPRLTIAQRNSILNPAAGLVIFCSDCFELEVSDGINWKSMNGTAACVSATLPSINIGSQTWMPTNLAVSKYRNGDNIPEVTDPAVWSNITTGAWCWYNNDSATYSATYGKLYNWYAVHDSRGLAPAGWHIPGDAEVNTLSAYLDGDAVAGYKMKEAGTVHWNSPNSAVNSSGFTGLPGGLRSTYGVFSSRGFGGYFWSATEQGAGSAIAYWLTAPNSSLFRGANEKWEGYSVRCVKD
jgi:uncharacterized protein (TIGR02145 family)